MVSYVLLVRKGLSKMMQLFQKNLSKAQQQQKRWYDSNACFCEFNPGDQVLVLLPSLINKLWTQSQGPYETKR